MAVRPAASAMLALPELESSVMDSTGSGFTLIELVIAWRSLAVVAGAGRARVRRPGRRARAA